MISFSAVSAPREKSVPGTLLLMVDGSMIMGMQNSGYVPRFSDSDRTAWYACTDQSTLAV